MRQREKRRTQYNRDTHRFFSDGFTALTVEAKIVAPAPLRGCMFVIHNMRTHFFTLDFSVQDVSVLYYTPILPANAVHTLRDTTCDTPCMGANNTCTCKVYLGYIKVIICGLSKRLPWWLARGSDRATPSQGFVRIYTSRWGGGGVVNNTLSHLRSKTMSC